MVSRPSSVRLICRCTPSPPIPTRPWGPAKSCPRESCIRSQAWATARFITGRHATMAHCFPGLPERTRLLRLFRTPQVRTETVLAAPMVLGVIDPYGIELMHSFAGTRRYFRRYKSGYGCPVCVGLWPSFVRPSHGTWSRDDERLHSLTEEEQR